MDTEVVGAFAEYQLARHIAANTIRNRESILRGLSAVVDGSIVDATVRDLRRFVGKPGLEPGTRRTYQQALRAFYGFLVDDEYRTDDPSVKLGRVEVLRGTPRPFTWEQIEAMLSSGAYTRTRAMILLGYFQGFRVSQIARVHGSDVDWLSMTIRTVGKKSKVAWLPLHPMIADLAATMPRADYWFRARGGRTGHIHGSSVTNLITKAKQRAGILDPKLTPHSLRHSFGTDLVEQDVDIHVVQELMMHESLETTQIYTRVSERRKREGLHALPSRVVPGQSGRAA